MSGKAADKGQTPIGLNVLHQAFGVKSVVALGNRRTRKTPARTHEFFPPDYATNGTLKENLRFALKHEPLDLYARIAETIDTDFREELAFLTNFDAALDALRGVVDMPDARARLLLKLSFQSGGRLSNNKRSQFAELTDGEVEEIGARVWSIL